MRILMVCLSAMGGSLTSGTSIRAARYTNYFKKNGVNFNTLFPNKPPFITKRIHPLFNFLWNLIVALPYLLLKYDTIYCVSDLLPDAIFGCLYKIFRPKTRFVCGCHSLVQRHIKGRTPLHAWYAYYSQRFILRMLRGKVDRLLVSNNYDKQILSDMGFTNVITIYPAPNV